MKKKIVWIIIIIISLAILSGIVYIMFFVKAFPPEIPLSKTALDKDQELSVDQSGKAGDKLLVEPVKQEIKRIEYQKTKAEESRVSQADLERMASSFAERFGSYSNQSNYSNINDLKIFMSTKMQNWADNYVGQIREQGGISAIYYGITTKALFQEVEEFDDDAGRAKIVVQTQRREATGTMANTTSFYQNIIISFVRTGKAWKVDSANWQET